MLALTLILPLLVASAGDCYLVTNDEIEAIPCDFSAAATDALRYAAEDAEAAKPRKPEPPPRVAPAPQRSIRNGTYRRRSWRRGGD